MKSMTDTNSQCRACRKPLASGWVASPYCGKPKQSRERRHQESLGAVTHNRFVCPGCGERASAEGWNMFCPECQAFVHFECMVHHMFTPHACPVCETEIGL
jgi:hypothetical protein